MNQVKHDDIRQAVRQKYGQVAESEVAAAAQLVAEERQLAPTHSRRHWDTR